MTGYISKKMLGAARLPDTPTARAYLRKVLDNDKDHGDIAYQSGYYAGKKAAQRPWVSLTDDEIKEIVGPWGDTPIKGYTRELIDKIEAKLKELNYD
jgi:hypothetical protein